MSDPFEPIPTGDRYVWEVPSDKNPAVKYRVDASANAGGMFCACPDFRARRQPKIDAGAPLIVPKETICKHCLSLILHLARVKFAEWARSETSPDSP